MENRRVIKFLKKIDNDDIFALSAQLTYYLILSVFPFLIFLITLISYTHIKSERAIQEILVYIPKNSQELFYNILNQVLGAKSIKLLSLGMIATLWTSSSGFVSLIKGLNKAYSQEETRSFWKVRVIAIFSTLILVFIFIISLFMLVFGEVLGKAVLSFIGYSHVFSVLWLLLRYSISLITMILIFSIIYYYTPCKKLHFKNIIPGAIFSTLGWITISTLFSFYVNNFANYSQMYGSIGGIIAILIWLYWSGIIVLLGGEINSLMYTKKHKIN